MLPGQEEILLNHLGNLVGILNDLGKVREILVSRLNKLDDKIESIALSYADLTLELAELRMHNKQRQVV